MTEHMAYPGNQAPLFELRIKWSSDQSSASLGCLVLPWGISWGNVPIDWNNPGRREKSMTFSLGIAQWKDITEIGPITLFTPGALVMSPIKVNVNSGSTRHSFNVHLADGRSVTFSQDYRFGWPASWKNLKPTPGTIKRVNIVQFRRILERAVANGQLA
jgi:hypothetical protein